MKNIVRTLGGLISPINGVEFVEFNDGSVSHPIADESLVEQFLLVDGYRLATDEDDLPEAVRPAPVVKPETAAQKKAREKAEKEAAEAAAKAAADAAAAEAEAKAKAAAEEAKTDEQKAPEEPAKDAGAPDSEVF